MQFLWGVTKMKLADRSCVPCKGGVPPLSHDEVESLISELSGWKVKDDKRIQKTYKTDDFLDSLEFANKIGDIAEEQGHHPDLLVRWGELGVEIWTHKINGLTESDFILAAKIDRLAKTR
jgi:4a-hydroxytetrahydrobiopterin dehydratase